MAETRAIKIERITKALEELLWADVLEEQQGSVSLYRKALINDRIKAEFRDLTDELEQRLIDRLTAWREEQAHEASQRAATQAVLMNTPPDVPGYGD